MLTRAKDGSGRQALAEELDDVKANPNAGKMVKVMYLTAKDVAMASGDIDEKEAATLAKIANRLGVDPSSFEF